MSLCLRNLLHSMSVLPVCKPGLTHALLSALLSWGSGARAQAARRGEGTGGVLPAGVSVPGVCVWLEVPLLPPQLIGMSTQSARTECCSGTSPLCQIPCFFGAAWHG